MSYYRVLGYTDGLTIDYQYIQKHFTFADGTEFEAITQQLQSVQTEDLCSAIKWMDPTKGLVSANPFDTIQQPDTITIDLQATQAVIHSDLAYWDVYKKRTDIDVNAQVQVHQCQTPLN